jgi:hypothetical protein
VIGHSGADHFYASNFSILYEKRFRYENTRRAIETGERIPLAGGQNARIHRALIESRMRPHNTALLIDHGIAAIMDVLHDEVVVPQLELRQAIHRICVDIGVGWCSWRSRLSAPTAASSAAAGGAGSALEVTFVVGLPFSMRWQSLVKGQVPVPLIPLPSFFCKPVK